MEIKFEDKVVLVTGGTRGIGKQIVSDFKKAGAKVYSIGSKDYDLSSKEGLDKLTQFISHLEKVDILVNNAGINFNQYIDILDENKFDKLMHVNIKAPFFITKEVAKKMKNQNEGRIVNIASIAGNRVRDGRSAYSTSKAGLIGFTKVIAAELAGHNILCNSVSPGFTFTEMTTTMLPKEEIQKHINQVPLKKLGSVRDISNTVLFLASDLNNFITGQDIIVDGGFINTITIG